MGLEQRKILVFIQGFPLLVTKEARKGGSEKCTRSRDSIAETKKLPVPVLKGKNVAKNLAPVLVIISGNSLAFSRKIITSTDFYRCCAAGASAPVLVKNQSPIYCDCDL